MPQLPTHKPTEKHETWPLPSVMYTHAHIYAHVHTCPVVLAQKQISYPNCNSLQVMPTCCFVASPNPAVEKPTKMVAEYTCPETRTRKGAGKWPNGIVIATLIASAKISIGKTGYLT